MNREHLQLCADLISVDLDDGLESGTLVFAADDSPAGQLAIRLPASAIVALRDALNDLSEDPSERRERRASVASDWAYSFLEEDVGEVRLRTSEARVD